GSPGRDRRFRRDRRREGPVACGLGKGCRTTVTRTTLKTPAEIALMDEANRIIRGILADLRSFVRPGVSTLEIDRFAERRIREAGGVAAFKGYPHRQDGHDFPGTVCASLNDEVVHGVPSERTVLRDGDILSVDLGILY